MLPKSAQEAWHLAASQCCTIQQVTSLISLAGSLTSKPLCTTIGCIDTPLLLEAPAGARMSPAPEAAAVAEPSLPYQQHAGSTPTAPCSPRSPPQSPFSRPLMISHESRLLILPAPQPHTCSLSALMAGSNTTSNAHWANPLLAAALSSRGHKGFQEPAQHATSSADAVVHLTVVHSIKDNSSKYSRTTSSATTSAVSSLNPASHGYSRAADSTASESPAGNVQDSLHYGAQAPPTTGAAMCSSPCITRPHSNSSSSVLRGTAEGTSDTTSSRHGSHTRFSGLMQLMKQARSSCFNESSSNSQGGTIAAGRPAGCVRRTPRKTRRLLA